MTAMTILYMHGQSRASYPYNTVRTICSVQNREIELTGHWLSDYADAFFRYRNASQLQATHLHGWQSIKGSLLPA
jgi:hypothetical protein